MRKKSKENFKSFTAQSSSIWHNPRIAWEDMAFALAGVNDITSKYARLKYADERSFHKPLVKYIGYRIDKLCLERGWLTETILRIHPDFLDRLAELAVHEMTASELCRKCKGKGTIYTGYTAIDCFHCLGSGVLKKTETFRARYVGLSLRQWRETWQMRFRGDILGSFDVFEYDIQRALRRRL